MLVLSRKAGERIILPAEGVTITVTAINHNRVCLGISAPAHVGIHREEVWMKLRDEQRQEQLQE